MKLLVMFLALSCSSLIYADANSDLLNAAYSKDLQGVKRALKAGVDVNARDKGGRTALMWAATRARNIDIMKLLIAAPGVDVNAQDKDGLTALMLAVQIRDKDMVQTLINAKAGLTIKNKKDQTALDLAKTALDTAKAIARANGSSLEQYWALERAETLVNLIQQAMDKK